VGNTLEDMTAPSLGSVIAGRYELTRFIGKGGMGSVYEASDGQGRHVAVKLLTDIGEAGADSMVRRRFERESTISAKLESPHIVKTLHAGVDEQLGSPFIVMPLMVGFDLRQLMKRLGPFNPTIAARIVRQVCLALEAAHEAGAVHRDIKPGNIFLDHGADGIITVRVLDFGVAKWLIGDGQLTATGTLLGTPFYMAPEQILEARTVDGRADVWSLGVVLYRLLCGKVPFDAKNVGDLYIEIVTSDTVMLQERAPWIDPALATVVHGVLIREPSDRCPSAEELFRALQPFTSDSDELAGDLLQPASSELRVRVTTPAARPTRWAAATPSVAPPPIPQMARDPWLGKTIGGKYKLLRALGAGGMATVYEARAKTGDRVALKVIDPRFAGKTQAARRRFVREASALTSIDNPHVVRVIEAGADADEHVPFIAMELLSGDDLGATLKRHGALPMTVVARIFSQTCKGLGATHSAGLVHRDVKPANIFLHQLPSGLVMAKLCDFGLVKRFAMDEDEETVTQLTQAGGVLGSPSYMSPEQARNDRMLDHRTDVWSLGVALYQALTGKPMWEDCTSPAQLILAICSKPVPKVQDTAPWVRPQLAQVVHTSLQRDPDRRFQNMHEFYDALQPLCAGVEQIRLGELSTVSQQVQHEVAPRYLEADAQSNTLGNAAAPISQVVQPRSRKPVAVAVAVGALAVGGFVALQVASPPPVTPEPATTTKPAAPATSEASAKPSADKPSAEMDVGIEVSPANAEVTVDGKQRALQDGVLKLRGAAGNSFEVVVTSGKLRVAKTVVIKSNGKTEPAKLALEEASKPGPAGPAKPTATDKSATPPPKPTATTPKPPKPSLTVDDWG